MHARNGPIYKVVFTYVVDGHWCGGEFTTGDEYSVGDMVAVRYDPNNPDRNDLTVKDTMIRWVIGGVAALVAIGYIVAHLL